jgi:hypothetical protein
MASWSPAPPPRAHAGRAQLVLALLGGLSILPPYLGPAIGLGLDVPADVEVVDHVVPAVAIALAAVAAAVLARRGEEAERSLLSLALLGLCFLGGLWQAATHLPLVLEGGGRAQRSVRRRGAALDRRSCNRRGRALDLSFRTSRRLFLPPPFGLLGGSDRERLEFADEVV